MIKLIDEFVSRLGVSLDLNENLIVKKQNRYFLLDKKLKKLIRQDFFYAGSYLGKVKNGKLLPSFNLLKRIAKNENANKIMVDKKTEWLFICGRDIFKQGITEATGSKTKGDYTLILNSHDECLGFGKILRNLNEEKGGIIIKNVSDVGDFLRREKQQG